MDTCFVIQPFDNGNFDKRFNDIFKPAIEKTNLTPYRIDKDYSVRVLIDDIEKGIQESSLCFAEITTDNPNVWYELGFAFACNKDVIMVCSDERTGKFPFDIQHRHIITYKTGSKSDFELLEEKITKKISAYLQNTKTVKTLHSTPVIETEGLKSHEIALLILLMENLLTKDESIPIYSLKSQMNKSGYTDVAASVAFRTLSKKDMIEVFNSSDYYNQNEQYLACRLTDLGESWVLENQDQLVFRNEDIKLEENTSSNEIADELPF